MTERHLSPPGGTRALGRFEITDSIWLSDPRWVNSKIAEAWRFFRGEHLFNDEPASPRMIRDDARLVLVKQTTAERRRGR